MVQLQVETEKLQLSCNVLPTGLAPEGIKLSNIWIQLAHETKGLIAQDYLQGKVDEDGLLQLEVHRLGINELGRYRLIVKYSYESPERSAEGRTKYECILPAFEVVREERRQRLGSSELISVAGEIRSATYLAPVNQEDIRRDLQNYVNEIKGEFVGNVHSAVNEYLPQIDLAGTIGLNPGNNSMSEHYQEKIQSLEERLERQSEMMQGLEDRVVMIESEVASIPGLISTIEQRLSNLETSGGTQGDINVKLANAISAIEELYQATGNPSPEERERIRQQRESDNNSNDEAISRGEAQPLDTSLSDFKLINLLDEINAIRQFVKMKKINRFG